MTERESEKRILSMCLVFTYTEHTMTVEKSNQLINLDHFLLSKYIVDYDFIHCFRFVFFISLFSFCFSFHRN